MKKLLDIAAFPQTIGTLECGHACAKMILDYNQKNISYDMVRQDMPVRPKTGLYIYEIGSYFMSVGYQAEITGFNTHYMNIDHIGASTPELKDQVLLMREKRSKEPRWEHLVPGLNTIVGFIDQGGILTAKIVTPDDIVTEIEANRPVLAAITMQFLNPAVPVGHNEHFAVITGYDDTHFSLNDPGTDPKCLEQEHTQDRIIFGIHANTGRSVEGGMILKLMPPTP